MSPMANHVDDYLPDLGPDDARDVRLAAAQDLLWALTNSPAFLFNR